MAELRWNPLLATWTMVATNRQNRPHLPKNWCPFCPGEGKNVPDNFTVISYLNDFPVLSQTPDAIASNSPFFMNEEAMENVKSFYIHLIMKPNFMNWPTHIF